jgi:solute carrier family 8 (sodium/calcium exchanger)
LYWLYTVLGKGYAALFVCIIMIGVMTAIIGDVASHFGCSVGIKDSVTAIVFVTLGTSVPGSP